MTIKELYEWAEDNDALNMEIGLQYQDTDEIYTGNTYECENKDIEAEIQTDEESEEDYVLLS